MITKENKSTCRLCGKDIDLNDESNVYIPNIIANEKCSLYIFNDGIFHQNCFNKHHLKIKIQKRAEIYESNNNRDKYIDYITKKELTIPNFLNPDNIIIVAHLTDNEKSPLYKYNDILINKLEINKWKEKDEFLNALNRADKSGEWGGVYLKKIIKKLEDNSIAPSLSKSFLERIKILIEEGKAQWWMKF